MNKRNIAMFNDNRLWEMANYWETKGHTVAVKNPDQVQNRFVEFKGLIKRGSFTMNQLEEKIFKAYGIMAENIPVGIEQDDALRALEELAIRLSKKNSNKKSEEKL